MPEHVQEDVCNNYQGESFIPPYSYKILHLLAEITSGQSNVKNNSVRQQAGNTFHVYIDYFIHWLTSADWPDLSKWTDRRWTQVQIHYFK